MELFSKTKTARIDGRKTAHNMGFSAMLAEEYVLIVPFAYQLHIGLNNKSQQKNITSTSVFQSASVPG